MIRTQDYGSGNESPRLVGFHRVRILLRITKPTRLNSQHAPLLYALLSTAYGQSRNVEPVMPDGIMLDAPEQCRLHLGRDEQYAFGLTILSHSPQDAAARLDMLLDGLRTVGRRASAARLALGGNFTLSSVEDLVSNKTRQPHQPLSRVPIETIARQVDRARGLSCITLRFDSPLRCQRSRDARATGHGYFDRDYFVSQILLNRLVARLKSLGIVNHEFQLDSTVPRVVLNQLVWLDASYGPKHNRKALGGSMGRVLLEGCGPQATEALVWGQYARVGGQTRFGFGRYHLEELADDRSTALGCGRAVGLWELSASSSAVDSATDRLELESGVLREAIAQVNDATYRPDPHSQVPINSGGKTRVLSIPSRRDRALQRLVLDQISPAIDLFLEESSLAYRHGLGRQRAAQRIRDAYRRGFRWGVKADFAAFFDNVDHVELGARVEAYLSDDFLAKLVMDWVRAGAPSPGRGLPTGAPLSPLLANILLDRFDEEVAERGGFLVRYADDFLILFRDEANAKAIYALAQEQAASLQLALNDDKTRIIGLHEPFDFLGYHFYKQDRWEVISATEPALLDDIGWHDSAKSVPRKVADTRLPGESMLAPRSEQATLIWGPGVERLRTQGKQFLGFYADSRPPVRVHLDRIRDLIVLGQPTIEGSAMNQLMKHGITVFLADENGRVRTTLSPEEQLEDGVAIAAQSEMLLDKSRRLALARDLVAAKLRNHATLAEIYPGRNRDFATARELRGLALKAEQATSIESLLGFEGAGARRWYETLPERLPTAFTFDHRVAPGANDPINVMLNIAHTALYRLFVLLIRQAGLVPSLGILHEVRQGHAALASDLHEAFRHLMERAVLDTMPKIRRSEFTLTDHPDYPLRVSPRAARELMSQIHRTLSISCHGKGQSEPRPYRYQAQAMVRSLKRHLLDPSQPFEIFEHP